MFRKSIVVLCLLMAPVVSSNNVQADDSLEQSTSSEVVYEEVENSVEGEKPIHIRIHEYKCDEEMPEECFAQIFLGYQACYCVEVSLH